MDWDDIFDEDFPIGAFIGAGIAVTLLIPWLWIPVGIVLGTKWWKTWRFRNLKAADQRSFFVDNEIFDRKPLMYLGTTQEGTIRWWYMRDGYGSYMVPQAIDDGKVYWNKKIQIKNPMLIVHLNGFAAMGNEWPEYYKTIMVPKAKHAQQNKSKKNKKQEKPEMILTYRGKPVTNIVQHPTSFDQETIKAVASKLPRADYAIGDLNEKRAGTAAMQSDAPLMDLIQTVKDLELDATGRCPQINFEDIE